MPFTTTTLVILSNFRVLEPICTSPRDRVPSKRPWVASVFTASMLLNAPDVTFKATAAAGASKISIMGVMVVDVVTLVAFVVLVEFAIDVVVDGTDVDVVVGTLVVVVGTFVEFAIDVFVDMLVGMLECLPMDTFEAFTVVL